MGYDAMCPGSVDLLHDGAVLAAARAYVSFPFVASNLRWNGLKPSWIEEYCLITRGGMRVAVLGLLNPERFSPKRPVSGGFSIEDPAVSLKRLLATIGDKADATVLLSRMGYDDTLTLVDEIEGIDIAICADEGRPARAGDGTRTHLVPAGYKAMALGLLTIVINEEGLVSVTEDRTLSLDDSVHDDEAVNILIEEVKASYGFK